jgi:hypothetical protein
MIISNTEITSKNTCDKQHDYMYNQELEPRVYSLHIRRGVAGHAILESYYNCRKDNWNHEAAVDYAMDTLRQIIMESDPDDLDHTKMLGQLSKLMIKYFELHSDDKFNVLAVEQIFTAPMIDGLIEFGMYLDVLIEHTAGEYRGSIDLLDHKFVNNFKTPDELRLDAQQPKYVKVTRLNGINVRQAIFNQIRYRSMKDPKPEDLFRRSPLMSTRKAVDTVWEEATQTAVDVYEQDKGIQLANNRRRQSYSACKYCPFKDLCMAELAGEDTTIMRQMGFQKRSRPLKDWMLSNA